MTTDDELRTAIVRRRVPAATDEHVRIAVASSTGKAGDRAALRAVPLRLLGGARYPADADAWLRGTP